MVKIVIFNSSNVVNDGTNSRYIYNFPQGGFAIDDTDKIGLCNASIYYSNFSITQYYNNNLLSITGMMRMELPTLMMCYYPIVI